MRCQLLGQYQLPDAQVFLLFSAGLLGQAEIRGFREGRKSGRHAGTGADGGDCPGSGYMLHRLPVPDDDYGDDGADDPVGHLPCLMAFHKAGLWQNGGERGRGFRPFGREKRGEPSGKSGAAA